MTESGIQAGLEEDALDYTVDAFHRGHFQLVQPKKIGHRSGMDAMILAATIPDDASGKLADLGAGAGAAGLAVASRVEKIAVTLVEQSPIMLDFARRSLRLDANAAYRDRIDILGADVTLAGTARQTAGLADRAYNWVILNPPYNDASDRRPPDELRAQARAMPDSELFEKWLKTACAILAPNGQVSVIARPGSIRLILDAFEGRFGATEITPVHPRQDAEALRILVTAIKHSRAALKICPPLIIHAGDGHGFSERMIALNNGFAALPRRSVRKGK